MIRMLGRLLDSMYRTTFFTCSIRRGPPTRPYRVYALFYDGLDQTFQSGRQILGQTISRRQLVMARPRAPRSSSHRDERWEGCRV